MPYTIKPFDTLFICSMSVIAKRFFQLLCFVLWALVLEGCAEGKFEIKDAWIAEAPPNVVAQAGYLTLENGTAKPMSLVNATSDAFGDIQIHRSEHDKATGFVKMIHEERADIPSHKSLKFEPGGYHLMLMNPKSALREGDQVAINLAFADGTEIKITFAVRREKFAF